MPSGLSMGGHNSHTLNTKIAACKAMFMQKKKSKMFRFDNRFDLLIILVSRDFEFRPHGGNKFSLRKSESPSKNTVCNQTFSKL